MNQISEQWIKESYSLVNQAIDIFFLNFYQILKDKTINTSVRVSCVVIDEVISTHVPVLKSSPIEGIQIDKGSIIKVEEKPLIAIFPMLEYPEKEDKFSKNKQPNNTSLINKIWIHVSHDFILNDYFIENHLTLKELQPIIKGFWSKEIGDYNELCFFMAALYDLYQDNQKEDKRNLINQTDKIDKSNEKQEEISQSTESQENNQENNLTVLKIIE